MKKSGFACAAALCLAVFSSKSISGGEDHPHVRARLVLGREKARPGGTVPFGIELAMDPGWHTYWKNPGDAGMATKVEWALPAGFLVAPLRWPYPERIVSSSIVAFGYEGTAMLISELRTPRAMTKSGETEISALVKWLECSDVCIPGKAKVSARLAFGAEAPINSEMKRAMAPIPAPMPKDWSATASRRGRSIELVVSPAPGSAAIKKDADFFPDRDGIVENGAIEIVDAANGGIALNFDGSHAPGSEKEKTLSGILVLKKDRRAYELSVSIQDQ